MDALQQQAMALDNSQRASHTLQRIETALLRCSKQTYGLCTNCEGPIDTRRLRFDPALLNCVDCASVAG
jgi:DnaK suppressor protein